MIPEHGQPWACKMPETDRDVLDVLQPGADWEPVALIENVGPGLTAGKKGRMGATSAFSFGRGFGGLLMALAAAQIPYERVTPGVWQKAMKCLTKGDKNVSKRRAQELFPSLSITHATADALLIAEHCRRSSK